MGQTTVDLSKFIYYSSSLAFGIFLTLIVADSTEGIGCYVCHSFNRTNELCEDPFQTLVEDAANYYSQKCMGYRKDRKGYFPADHCIKIDGFSTTSTNKTIMIRTCSLDSGTLTADTEIVRMSHCGHFRYNDEEYSGCVQSCGINGCNLGSKIAVATNLGHVVLIVVLVAFLTFRVFER